MDDLGQTMRGEPVERHAGSFLVRVWREPSGGREGLGPVRCLIRDLKTGREECLADVRDLIPLLVTTVDEHEAPLRPLEGVPV